MKSQPNQMWLDGLYMAGPLEAEYSATFGEQCYIETAIEQIILMRDHIQDPETKLLYHAWDPTKEIDWADAETGLSEEFWGLIDFYRKHETERGKKETTVYHETLNAVSFLCHLKDRGITRLEDVAENDVVSFFLSENGEQIRGCSYKKNISAVLKAGTYWKKDACNKILLLLPAFRETRKTIQYLTGDEVKRIADALSAEDSGLSLRDRAVGCLLLYTGMRGCDIACLLREAVDWNSEQIRIIQRKTGIPLELPLTPTVGNAIYDYLDLERPESRDGHVFLSEIMP